jgi:hypothetical protein
MQAFIVLDREPDREYVDDVIYGVDIATFAKAHGILPQAGGLRDQDSRDVWLIKNGITFLAEREELERKRNQASQH